MDSQHKCLTAVMLERIKPLPAWARAERLDYCEPPLLGCRRREGREQGRPRR